MSTAGMAFTIEPYRRGTSFTDWFTRLKYFFNVNKVKEEDKMAYFITMSEPVIFSEIKLLYPTGNFEEAALEDVVSKLKNRLDKTDPDLVQRYKFSTRIQHPDEPTEDFILGLKLQAEFCGFGNFKDTAILDRIIAGIRDKNLRQKLLGEEKLTLANAEKMITTWEVARTNAGAADHPNKQNMNMVAAVCNESHEQGGVAMGRLRKVYELANKYQHSEVNEGASTSRGPVKSRLGFKPFGRNQQYSRGGRMNQGTRYRNFRQGEGRFEGHRQWQRPDYSQMICDFCKVKGHVKKML